MNPDTKCHINQCPNPADYHIQFTHPHPHPYPYCQTHTKIGWYQTKRRKWVDGWPPHTIETIHDKWGNPKTLKQTHNKHRY